MCSRLSDISNWKEFKTWYIRHFEKCEWVGSQLKSNSKLRKLFEVFINNDLVWVRNHQNQIAGSILRTYKQKFCDTKIQNVAQLLYGKTFVSNLSELLLRAIQEKAPFKFVSLIRSPHVLRYKDQSFWFPIIQSLIGADSLFREICFLTIRHCSAKTQKHFFNAFFQIKANSKFLTSFLILRWKNHPNFLATAIIEGELSIVSSILSLCKKDRVLKDQLIQFNRSNILHLAISRNNLPAIEEIIDCFKDDPGTMNQLLGVDEDGNSPIHLAILQNEFEILEQIYQACNPHSELINSFFKPDSLGINPLLLAILKLKIPLAEWLLKRAPKECFKSDFYGWNPLTMALKVKKIDFAHLILDSSKDWEIKTILFEAPKMSLTPLGYAVHHGSMDLVEKMINMCRGNKELKHLLFSPDVDQWTPLTLAIKQNQTSIALTLLKYCRGDTILKEIALMPNHAGESPLNLALLNKMDEVVDQLLLSCRQEYRLCSLLFQPNHQGYNPLHRAIHHKNLTAVQKLIHACQGDKELKMMLFCSDANGTIPLTLALSLDSPEIIKELIKACGEDLDLKRQLFEFNSLGWSPLDYAVDHANEAVIAYLLDFALEMGFSYEQLLHDPDVCVYFFEHAPHVIQEILDKTKLTKKDKFALLPFFKPNQIAHISESLTHDHLEESMMTAEGIFMVKDYIQHLLNKDLTSEENLRSMVQKTPILFKHFAAFAKFESQSILPILSFLSNAQLACVIPNLNYQFLIPFMQSERFISHATTAQKENLLPNFISNFSPISQWNIQDWKSLISDCQKGIQDLNNEMRQKFGQLSILIETGPHVLNQFTAAICLNERSKFKDRVAKEMGHLYTDFEMAIQEVAQIRKELDSLYKMSLKDQDFLDPFTDEPIVTPIKLPQIPKWIDETSLEHLVRDERGWIKHPFLSNTYFPPEEYAVDLVFLEQINKQSQPACQE